MTHDPTALTPIEKRGGIYFKRDDLFSIGGVAGGKVRTCWHLSQGASGLVTAGSRMSPQVNIVAHIAKKLGIPCRCHTPTGALSPEVLDAQNAGAEIVQHIAGYNTVIVSRARRDAQARGWREIPFGMECEEAIRQTRRQVARIPKGVKRIVVPVGSGMSLSGILWGLLDAGRGDMPVLGVMVGAEPFKRLDRYAPSTSRLVNPSTRDWRAMVTLINAGMDYHKAYPEPELGGVGLDPIYEAKVIPYLEEGDLLWVVGIRATAQRPDDK